MIRSFIRCYQLAMSLQTATWIWRDWFIWKGTSTRVFHNFRAQAGHTTSMELLFAIVRRVLPKIINTKDMGDFRGAILTEMWNYFLTE